MSKYYKLLLIILGTTCFLLSILVYFLLGYNVSVLIFWFTSILTFVTLFYLYHSKVVRQKFTKKDVLAIVILLLVFIPIYTLNLHDIPFQISADEVTIMKVERELISKVGIDYFGVSNYFAFPTLFFWILGKFGTIMGGITLSNMRFLHAFSGVLIALFSYIYFRSLGKSRLFSTTGTVFVTANHSLLAISRMAMRDNVPVLLELICLSLFYLGVKRRDYFFTLVSGLVAGIGFYTYFPARLVPVICLFFLFMLSCIKRNKSYIRSNLKIAAVFLLGVFLTSNLVLIDTYKNLDRAMNFPKEQLLIYKEGRSLQQRWVNARTIEEGINTNIKNGLTLFNNSIVDHGWIYVNPGHGFVDPVTGILVWLGFLTVLWKIKKEKKESDILTLCFFVISILCTAFIVNKAPDYTRVLTLLPFAAYLSVQGLFFIIQKSTFSKRPVQLFAFISVVILTLNLGIYINFIKLGKTNGDDIGSTVRYVENNINKSDYTYYLVYNLEYPFYSYPGTWYSYFMNISQVSLTIDPNQIENTELKTPSTLFMSKRFFEKIKPDLESKYTFKIKNMTPDGRLVAVEIK